MSVFEQAMDYQQAAVNRCVRAVLDEIPLDELWKTPRRTINWLRFIKGELTPSLAQTPSREVARWGRVRLLRYETAIPEKACPVLMVPSIINKYYVLDLRPGRSMVEHLSKAGIPVYMLDWGEPGPQDRFATMEDHIVRWLDAAVRRACRDASVEKIHLLGYCIGGTFASMYAAVRPKRVAGLIALTSPVNFHDEGLLSAWAGEPSLDIDRMAEVMGLIPAELLQASFFMLSPSAQISKITALINRFWDEGYVERFLALETWLNDNVDFPGATYVRHIRDLYRGNKLIKGTFCLDGVPVHLEDITCPVLTAISTRDHIVPDPSAAVFHDLVSSRDRTLLKLEGGHIGVTVGRRASDNLWHEVSRWLTERPCQPLEHHSVEILKRNLETV